MELVQALTEMKSGNIIKSDHLTSIVDAIYDRLKSSVSSDGLSGTFYVKQENNQLQFYSTERPDWYDPYNLITIFSGSQSNGWEIESTGSYKMFVDFTTYVAVDNILANVFGVGTGSVPFTDNIKLNLDITPSGSAFLSGSGSIAYQNFDNTLTYNNDNQLYYYVNTLNASGSGSFNVIPSTGVLASATLKLS